MSHQPDSAAPNDIPLHRPDDSGWSIVEQSGFLRGVSFNGPNGPYKCSRQVFRVQDDAVYSVQACQDISNEELYPANEVDAAYIHMGWPVPSALPARPWDVMYQQPKATSGQGNWVSRRMVIHKWTVSLRKEDLVPVEAFINEVEEALKESGVADQMEALRGVFAAWGEMIALAAVIGCSLAATGTLGSKQTLTGDSATFRPPDRGPDLMQMIDHSLDITGNFERRFESRIQGGYPETFSNSGFNAWLTDASKIDNYSTWGVVKVNHAVPITDLLPKSLRQKVARLFSYPVGSQIAFGFDGASLGVKGIKQINIWHKGAMIKDISIVYTDGSATGPYMFGISNRMSSSLVLAPGEFIAGVFIWATSASTNAIQFVKNTFQLSVRYGVQKGTVDILTAGGNPLLGLSGTFKEGGVEDIRAVWLSDVKSDEYGSFHQTEEEFSMNGEFVVPESDPATDALRRNIIEETRKRTKGKTPYKWQVQVTLDKLAGKDMFVVAGTGAGKSLTFGMVPFMVPKSITWLLAPLNYIEEQLVKEMEGWGVPAVAINQNSNWEEEKRNILRGKYQVVISSPEAFLNVDRLRNVVMSPELENYRHFGAVDEAHVIHTWGAGFRVDYGCVGNLRAMIYDVPFMAVTATATPTTKKSIIECLHLGEQRELAEINLGNFRSNIEYSVHLMKGGSESYEELFQFFPDPDNIPKTLIFVDRTHDTHAIATKLRKHLGIEGTPQWDKIRPYHANRAQSGKDKCAEDFINGKCDGLTSTEALTMGANFDNVELVIQLPAPNSAVTHVQRILLAEFLPGLQAFLKRNDR